MAPFQPVSLPHKKRKKKPSCMAVCEANIFMQHLNFAISYSIIPSHIYKYMKASISLYNSNNCVFVQLPPVIQVPESERQWSFVPTSFLRSVSRKQRGVQSNVAHNPPVDSSSLLLASSAPLPSNQVPHSPLPVPSLSLAATTTAAADAPNQNAIKK